MQSVVENEMSDLAVSAFAIASVLVLADAAHAQPVSQEKAIAACMGSAAMSLGFNGTIYAANRDLAVERSFGTSDADGKVPNASGTRFNIGSVNKMFVAVAIGKLVDRGAIQFDAPIARYLPDLKPEFAGITIAELLDHTSGLGDYFRPENRAVIDAAKTATDLLPLALAAPPAFVPGSKRAYSNSGFIVLGAIIEKVSGLTWSQFIQNEILYPVGMSDTRFDSIGGATPMSRMSPAGLLDKPRPAPGPVLASPAGGMFSTPSDLSRFLTALFSGHLLSMATLDVMLTPRPDPAGGPGTSGYGFVVRKKPTPEIGIGGGAPGVSADVDYFPESGWQLLALSNSDPSATFQIDRVLEQAISAHDIDSACAAALADPKLRVGPTMLIGPPVKPERQ
jgi:CubicO group peptidase (beta-lactamase class C family)